MAGEAVNYLAFDLGAESGRAMLGALGGGKLSLSEVHRFANPNGRIGGHYHWDLLAQWQELKTGLRLAAQDMAGRRRELAGIGVDTWGVDYGLLDRSGELLGYPYMYRDSRTDGMMERAFARVSRQRIFEATGIQFMQFNTLFQLFAAAQARSAALEVADALLFMPDLFNYLFTGQKVNEFSIATTSQMYDPRKKAWATEMLAELGIPTHFLRPIVPSGTVLAALQKGVAEECGAGPVPVIAPGCHDTASAIAAVPAGEGGDWCYISSGTWSLMGLEAPEPIINDKSLRYNYTNEGGVGGRIRFLKNIMGLWLVQECRRFWQKEGHDLSYGQLTEMAAGEKGPGTVVDPDHGPFLAPGEMPRKISEFCQKTRQAPPATPGQFVRVCLDSLALTYRRTLEGLEDVLGRRIGVIHIVGGGSRNALLNQMTADACGRPVIAGPDEATSIGNILVQAMAVGQVKSLAEVRRIVRDSFEVTRFEPREPKRWDAAYDRFRQIVK